VLTGDRAGPRVSTAPTPEDIDAWLAALELSVAERTERDGVASWDLVLDGRRRQGIRVTVILEPSLVLVVWVHYAPPIMSSFRISYRKLLRWNDELPFVKFGVADDERPILTSEIPAPSADLEALGLALARVVAVCDLLIDESVPWLWPSARHPPEPARPSRHTHLLDRYAADLGELVVPVASAEAKAR
jgi:hypothetical protein